jgi:hypothetical protein
MVTPEVVSTGVGIAILVLALWTMTGFAIPTRRPAVPKEDDKDELQE